MFIFNFNVDEKSNCKKGNNFSEDASAFRPGISKT